jgi:hypothetical protein
MARTLKRDMARELDNLRHAVSQLQADKARLQAELATTRPVTERVVSIGRAALLARAKELSIATGVMHRVSGWAPGKLEAWDAETRQWI